MNKDDDIIDITDFDLSKKKKKKIKKQDIVKNKLYNYDFLCDRLYNSLKENNPELYKKNNKITIPNIRSTYINRKTYWINFYDFITCINRDIDFFIKYLSNNLKTICSKIKNNQLKINGRYTCLQLESISKEFISKYVLCNNCKSLNTIIKRHDNTRLNILFCNNCTSEKCI